MGKYSAMTVNERLFEAGLLNAWDAAAKARSRAEMVDILLKVELGDDAEPIADGILANPAKFGF